MTFNKCPLKMILLLRKYIAVIKYVCVRPLYLTDLYVIVDK